MNLLKKCALAVFEGVLTAILGLAIFIFGMGAVFFVLFNVGGLLLGFEQGSDGCREYRNKDQSNFSYYFFPITPYACKENGGLLQPAVKDLFDWLGSTHK